MEGESWLKLAKRPLGMGTGFSLKRWGIPEDLNYEGFAIYLDADQLLLSDISGLWNQNLNKPVSSCYCTYQHDKWFANAPNTSVMLIDCEKAKTDWWTMQQVIHALELDCPNRKAYIDLMHAKHINPAPVKIDDSWNRLNLPKDGEANNILHFTIEHTQPWFNPQHPFRYIWKDFLVKAIADGYVQKTECQEAIKMFKAPTKESRGTGLNPYWLKWVK
jgi:hypothetical protein